MPGLGLVVSRKYGNAVKRNKFKRRCRELFYNQIKKGMHLQVIIIPRAGSIKYTNIKRSIGCFLKETNHG